MLRNLGLLITVSPTRAWTTNRRLTEIAMRCQPTWNSDVEATAGDESVRTSSTAGRRRRAATVPATTAAGGPCKAAAGVVRQRGRMREWEIPHACESSRRARFVAVACVLLPLTVTTRVVSAQSAPIVIARGLNSPRHLAFSPNGDLYVVEAGRGGPRPGAQGRRTARGTRLVCSASARPGASRSSMRTARPACPDWLAVDLERRRSGWP